MPRRSKPSSDVPQLRRSRSRVVTESTCEPSRCVVFGPALRGCLPASIARFRVFCRDADGRRLFNGGDHVEVACTSPDGGVVRNILVQDNGDSTYDVSIRPQEMHGTYVIVVKVNGKELRSSPLKMVVADGRAPGAVGSRCVVTGNGLYPKRESVSFRSRPLQDGRTSEPACPQLQKEIIVEAYDSDGTRVRRGGDECRVKIVDSRGSKVNATVTDNFDGTYTVRYTVEKLGEYRIRIWVNGELVKGCPRTKCFVRLKMMGKILGLEPTSLGERVRDNVLSLTPRLSRNQFGSPDAQERTPIVELPAPKPDMKAPTARKCATPPPRPPRRGKVGTEKPFQSTPAVSARPSDKAFPISPRSMLREKRVSVDLNVLQRNMEEMEEMEVQQENMRAELRGLREKEMELLMWSLSAEWFQATERQKLIDLTPRVQQLEEEIAELTAEIERRSEVLNTMVGRRMRFAFVSTLAASSDPSVINPHDSLASSDGWGDTQSSDYVQRRTRRLRPSSSSSGLQMEVALRVASTE